MYVPAVNSAGFGLHRPSSRVSAASGTGFDLVSLPPVVPFGQHRFAGVRATAILEVALIVRVAHQRAAIPGDCTGDTAEPDCPIGARLSACHCLCTSRSPAVAIMPDGANILDGT